MILETTRPLYRHDLTEQDRLLDLLLAQGILQLRTCEAAEKCAHDRMAMRGRQKQISDSNNTGRAIVSPLWYSDRYEDSRKFW